MRNSAGALVNNAEIKTEYGYVTVACIEVGNGRVPPKMCPTPHHEIGQELIPVFGGSTGNYFINHAIYMKTVERYYIFASMPMKLYCWDWKSKGLCSGWPKVLDGLSANVFNHFVWQADKTRIWATTDKAAYCFDVTTDELCSGAWPSTFGTGATAGVSGFAATWAPSNHMSTRFGAVDGFCMYWGCMDFSGSLRTDWGPNPYRQNWVVNGATYCEFEPHLFDVWVADTQGTVANQIPRDFPTTPMGQTFFFNPYNVRRA